MNLFDELEQDAKLHQPGQVAPEDQGEDLARYYKDYCAPLMRRFQDYLKKLSDHIQKVGYTRTVQLDVPQFGTVEGTVQPEVKLSSTVSEDGMEIKLEGNIHIDRDSAPVRSVNPASCAALEREIKQHALRASKRNATDEASGETLVAYRIFGDLKQIAVIKASRTSKKISMMFCNIDSLCVRRKTILAEQIDKAFFDEIGRFLTGKSVAMFEEKVSSDVREQIQRKLILEKSRQSLELLEAEITRIDRELEDDQESPSILKRQFDRWLDKFLRKDG